MLILSRVCAEFHDPAGQTIFTVRRQDLLSFLEAPEAIQFDPLFQLMLKDGSLEAVRSVEQRRELEADPATPTTAKEEKTSTRKGSRAEKTAVMPASATPAPEGTSTIPESEPASADPASASVSAPEPESTSTRGSKKASAK